MSIHLHYAKWQIHYEILKKPIVFALGLLCICSKILIIIAGNKYITYYLTYMPG